MKQMNIHTNECTQNTIGGEVKIKKRKISSSKKIKNRYKRALFILAKIEENERNGTPNEMDHDGRISLQKDIEEYQRYKASQAAAFMKELEAPQEPTKIVEKTTDTKLTDKIRKKNNYKQSSLPQPQQRDFNQHRLRKDNTVNTKHPGEINHQRKPQRLEFYKQQKHLTKQNRKLLQNNQNSSLQSEGFQLSTNYFENDFRSSQTSIRNMTSNNLEFPQTFEEHRNANYSWNTYNRNRQHYNETLNFGEPATQTFSSFSQAPIRNMCTNNSWNSNDPRFQMLKGTGTEVSQTFCRNMESNSSWNFKERVTGISTNNFAQTSTSNMKANSSWNFNDPKNFEKQSFSDANFPQTSRSSGNSNSVKTQLEQRILECLNKLNGENN